SYVALKEILKNKAHHIITTNADNAFAVAGYDLDKVFHIQGEYILWQCSQHCHPQTYRDDEAIRQMIQEQSNMEVPRELVPHCPKCDAPMENNKRKAQVGMVEDAEIEALQSCDKRFLAHRKEVRVIYLELSTGYSTRQFVTHPLQRMARQNPDALFMTLNKKA